MNVVYMVHDIKIITTANPETIQTMSLTKRHTFK